MPRTGRRPGDSGTRERILTAARDAFAGEGYDRATIRSIAAAAGVDPALVHHYFGTKEDLSTAVVALPGAAGEVAAAIVAGGREGAGERITRLFFTIWERPDARQPLLAMIRGALTGNVPGTTAFREFVEHGLLAKVAPLIDADDRELRMSAVAGHLVGVAIARYVIEIEPLASASVDDLVGLIAPRIQSYVDGGG